MLFKSGITHMFQSIASCRRFFVVGLLSIISTISFAQFKRLIVQAPDTVYVGEAFEMKVVLESNGWTNGHWEGLDYPFSYRKTLNNKTSRKGSTSELTLSIELSAIRDGMYDLPRFKVKAAGKERLSSLKQICVLPHRTYGSEQTMAYKWFAEECKQKSPHFEISYHDSCLSVFTDNLNKFFVFVANHRYWDRLSNPILAYSTESNYYVSKNKSLNDPLINQYTHQLMILDTLQTSDEWQTSNEISPLLGKTAWGQNAPYNFKTPKFDDKSAPIGCQVVALAQIMRYYKHPSVFEGHCWFHGPDDNCYRFDIDQWVPKWDAYVDTYSKEAGNANDSIIADLCSLIAVSIDANFTEKETSGSFRQSYRAKCSNFGYSTRMSIMSNTSEKTILDAICQELRLKRPCIASWNGHSFVCDGIKNGYLHYNLGWNGYANGYYRPILYEPSDSNVNNMLIKYLLIGIEPEPAKNEVTIRTSKGGQLQDILSDEQKCTVTHLKIVGRLNSKDIKLIRHMAGAVDYDAKWNERTGGSLCFLDLSEAKIVGDKDPFLTLPATDTWTHSRTSVSSSATGTSFSTSRAVFDFNQMDEKRWKEFCWVVGKSQDGIKYERVDDNHYLAHFHTVSNVISSRLFKDCVSLKTVLLPRKTSSIDMGAFSNCLLLNEIDIPKAVLEVGNTSFTDCSSLENIIFHKKYNNIETWGRNCSPVLRVKYHK